VLKTIGIRLALVTIPLAALAALILYAYSTGFISVSCDEYDKTLTACRGLSDPSLWFARVWLPLHFPLIAGTSLLTGDLLLAGRLVSITFGAFLIVALFGIGRQFGGNPGGAFAAILGATHPLVALLSATAMVDICYVSTFIMGLRVYLKFHHSERPGPTELFAACGLFTLACAFHYNAWIAVLVLVPFLLRRLYLSGLRAPIIAGSLVVLGSVPCAWVGWNWAQTGKFLGFFSHHSEYSAHYWSHLGWEASPRASVAAIYGSLTLYSPLLAVLAFAAIGILLKGRSAGERQVLQWTLLTGFLAGLVLLYSTGGRPAAFEPRYVLLPSVLMISIASGTLVTLWRAGPKETRAFILFLTIAAVFLNVRLFRETMARMKEYEHFAYANEARDVAASLHNLRSKHAPRLVLEVKKWNFLAMSVFVNRADAVVMDRELINDSVRHFDNPSMLLGARDPVVGELRAKGVGFIAAWSPAVQSNIESWGLERLASVDSYRVYRIPK
jgi:4-amino-4-deoxy-L-arabinose transferase-like glycosyltransferase